MLRFRPCSAIVQTCADSLHSHSWFSQRCNYVERPWKLLTSFGSACTQLRFLNMGNPKGFLSLGLGLPLRPTGPFTPSPTALNHRHAWDLLDGTRVHRLRGPRGLLTLYSTPSLLHRVRLCLAPAANTTISPVTHACHLNYSLPMQYDCRKFWEVEGGKN